MRLIIAGSRDLFVYVDDIHRKLRAFGRAPSEIISGHAPGPDRAGEDYARRQGIPLVEMPVTANDWKRDGKKAGILRNIKMAQHSDALLAYWDGQSPGTKNMIEEATNRGLEVIVVYRKK